MRGRHVGSYLPSSGVWHHTQRFLKKKNTDPSTIQHLDFDAPTRELAQLLPDDKVLLTPAPSLGIFFVFGLIFLYILSISHQL